MPIKKKKVRLILIILIDVMTSYTLHEEGVSLRPSLPFVLRDQLDLRGWKFSERKMIFFLEFQFITLHYPYIFNY